MTDDPDRDDDKLALRDQDELEAAERGDFMADMAAIAGDATLATAALLGGPIGGGAAIGLKLGWKLLESKFGPGAGRRTQQARRERFERELDKELDRIRALLKEQGEMLEEHEQKLLRFATLVHAMVGPAFMATDELKVKWLARAIANTTLLDGVKASAAAATVRDVGEMEPVDLRVVEALVGESSAIPVVKLAEQLQINRTHVAASMVRLAERHLVKGNIPMTGPVPRHDKLINANVAATEAAMALVELCTKETL